ncbi:MAG: aldehyde dehydrogenase family protein [Candidatus Gottesmanbacteria bacterium]|nr:aldehyde dehydrogenase family protein [Candidatus Gottesmanbacteria bacterium]
MKKLISTNPAKNYEVLGSVDVSTSKEINSKITKARSATAAWKALGVVKRIEFLQPLYQQFLKRKKEIALLVTREIGKPITESKSDLDWDDGYFQDFLEQGPTYLEDEISYQKDKKVHRLVYEPLGIAAVIVPWNYPFGNFLWGVVPNLIAGNTVVFKHSEECPLMGKLIDEMMDTLHLPEGVFSQIYGGGKVGEQLVNGDIDLIWFTGSTGTGKKLYEIAGKKFIKGVMELGGSNPAVVFEDVNIDTIIGTLYTGRFMNCGQVCDATKRLIVHKSIYGALVKKLEERLADVKIGDPESEGTQLGSLVAKRQLELLEGQVSDAVTRGARIVSGGSRPVGLRGAYYLPTLLTNVKRPMRVWKEEVFGPVLPVIPFQTEEEAIELANDTPYGLGAQVFSKDVDRALRVANKINAGCVDVNEGNHWQPCTPFGGFKGSGKGREHGKPGFQELCQIKVIALG